MYLGNNHTHIVQYIVIVVAVPFCVMASVTEDLQLFFGVRSVEGKLEREIYGVCVCEREGECIPLSPTSHFPFKSGLIKIFIRNGVYFFARSEFRWRFL